MRKLPVLLVLALLMLTTRADFYDLSLSVTVKVNMNGSAHVTEVIRLSMDSGSEDLYNRSIYSRELTIMDWQQITKSQYLRQHILSAGSTRNMRIVPEDLRRYSYGELSTANIKLDYDIDKIATINQTGPRTVLYKFNNSALSFQSSPSGQVLPRNNELTIIIPPDSVVTSISPDPADPPITRDYMDHVRGVSNFTWRGTAPIMEFELTFSREESMDVEVRRFFEEMHRTALSILLSAPGIMLILVVIILVAYLVLSKR